MTAGRYIAVDRGAFERESQPEPEPARQPGTAQLFEIAAAHDGQPAREWLEMFWRLWHEFDNSRVGR